MAANLTFRNTNPDQLDRMVRVAPPLGWAVLAVLVGVIAAGLAWSVLSTAPVKVGGRGVLLSDGGLALVAAPDAGVLADLPVRVGDRVVAGDLLARLAQPTLQARIDTLRQRLESVTAERARLAAFHIREEEVRAAAEAQRLEGLERTAAALRAQESALLESLGNQQNLRDRGYAIRDRVLALETDLANARQQIATTADAVTALAVEADQRTVRAERELLEVDNRIAAAAQELAEARADLAARSEVRAQGAGRVVELSAAPGDRVDPGASLMRIVGETGGGLSALLFVPPADGKKVRVGMTVQVVPSTVRMEREGFIRAEVVAVSEIPATRAAIQRTLKNEAMVETLLTSGPPFEVRVRLIADPATVSGFAWSTDLGAVRAVESGTVIDGHVVVERIRLIALVFPKVDNILHWLGLSS